MCAIIKMTGSQLTVKYRTHADVRILFIVYCYFFFHKMFLSCHAYTIVSNVDISYDGIAKDFLRKIIRNQKKRKSENNVRHLILKCTKLWLELKHLKCTQLLLPAVAVKTNRIFGRFRNRLNIFEAYLYVVWLYALKSITISDFGVARFSKRQFSFQFELCVLRTI